MSRVIPYTLPSPVPGYEALTFVVDLGMTGEAYDQAIADGNQSPALLDIPNWEQEAQALGLPKEKPAFPLTMEGLNRLGMLLTRYVSSVMLVSDAMDAALEARHPNSKRN